MILEGISLGNPRNRKNREKTISDEINDENQRNEESSTGDDNSDDTDTDSSSNESEEQPIFNKRI